MEDSKLEDLVKTIEHEMYIFYDKNVSTKYKTKYRTLLFNIKDEKNSGLFRKIINGTLVPKVLVAMSPEDLANKELKEWRQAELKQDIEKIMLILLQLSDLTTNHSKVGDKKFSEEKNTLFCFSPALSSH